MTLEEAKKERKREQRLRATAAWRTRNPEKVAAGRAAYREKNREVMRQAVQNRDPQKVREASARYREAHPEKVRECARKSKERNTFASDSRTAKKEAELLRKYGMTLSDWNALLEKQRGQCAICDRDMKASQRGPCVDHCHKSGSVRQLLCSPCNTALGLFRDDPRVLQRAIEYLSEHQEPSCFPQPTELLKSSDVAMPAGVS